MPGTSLPIAVFLAFLGLLTTTSGARFSSGFSLDDLEEETEEARIVTGDDENDDADNEKGEVEGQAGTSALRAKQESMQKISVDELASALATLTVKTGEHPGHTYAGADPKEPHLAFFCGFDFEFSAGAGHSVGLATTHFLKGLNIPADIWLGFTPGEDGPPKGQPSEKPCKGPAKGQRYLVITLAGYVQFETCLATEKNETNPVQPVWTNASMSRALGRERADIYPGHLLVADDAIGPAHHWRIMQNPHTGKYDPWERLYIDLTPQTIYDNFMSVTKKWQSARPQCKHMIWIANSAVPKKKQNGAKLPAVFRAAVAANKAAVATNKKKK